MIAMHIWFIILSISIVIIIINNKFISKLIPTSYEGKRPQSKSSPLLGTGNGIGITLQKGDRYDCETHCYVYYSFITILIPIIPIGCYLAEQSGEYYKSHKKTIKTYKIYGHAKWNILEISSMCLSFYAYILIVISVLGIISNR